jgi:hypothetical protein
MNETKRTFFKVAALPSLGLSTLTLDAPRANEPEPESTYDRDLREVLRENGVRLV